MLPALLSGLSVESARGALSGNGFFVTVTPDAVAVSCGPGLGRAMPLQQTCSYFTAWGMPQSRVVLYAIAVMNGRCNAKARRRVHAAAVACALSLFVALVAGSALRPHYTTNALPEPAAWTHTVERVQHDFNQARPVSATGSLIALKASGSSRPVPIARKPFRYVWMTHDLPSNWVPLSPLLNWSALPKSFVSAQFQPGGAPCAAFAGDSDTRQTSTLFCIIRC